MTGLAPLNAGRASRPLRRDLLGMIGDEDGLVDAAWPWRIVEVQPEFTIVERVLKKLSPSRVELVSAPEKRPTLRAHGARLDCVEHSAESGNGVALGPGDPEIDPEAGHPCDEVEWPARAAT